MRATITTSTPTRTADRTGIKSGSNTTGSPTSTGKPAKQPIVAQLELALRNAQPEERFQFERLGYLVADPIDPRDGAPGLNRSVTLKDSWGKSGG